MSLVKHKRNENVYAMKVTSKAFLVNSKNIQCTLEERDALTRIKHPFIVELVAAFQTDLKVCLLMEFVIGGELFCQLHQRSFFLVDEARFYYQVSQLKVQSHPGQQLATYA